MYHNIYYNKYDNFMHVWDDVHGYFKFPYAPYAYIRDDRGESKTLDGVNVRKITSWDKQIENSGLLYEHDIKPEMRTLIDIYCDSDDVSVNHNILFIDIEVSKELKYSPASEAKNPMLSICVFESIVKKMNLFIVDKSNKIDSGLHNGVDIKVYKSEIDMLHGFIEYYKSVYKTIITGWNIIGYDLPYLYNRSERLFGKWIGSWLSPIGKVENYKTKNGVEVFKIAGVAVMDYMNIYKALVPTKLPSYNLDAVCMHELGVGKIKYTGSLQELYETDLPTFLNYNINDVQLLIDLDSKLDFIAISQGLCHKGHVPYDDIYYPSRYTEGACITESKRRNIVVTNSSKNFGDKAVGALVKESKAGLHSWVYDLDLVALYPSTIITLNISPETKIGKIINWNSYEFVSGKDVIYNCIMFPNTGNNYEKNISSSELRDLLEVGNLCVAGNGVLYDRKNIGLIPSILIKWLDERSEFRKLSKKYYDENNSELGGYYDRKQKIQKVLNNVIYGTLLLPSFRFYDLDNGEAVTITGQQIITYTQTMMNIMYNHICKTDNIDYCTYSDTDSVDGSSVVTEKEFGNIRIDELYNKYSNVEHTDSLYENKNRRGWVFPSGCYLPYYDESNKSVKYGEVEYIEKHEVKKKRYRLSTKSGKSVIVSMDHCVMKVSNDFGLIECTASDIKIGDRVISLAYEKIEN